jgi:hypothetical protein
MFIGLPIILTHIFIGYLLKDIYAYCGFMDNGALAPSPQRFLEYMKTLDIWWYAPGFLIQTIIFIIINDSILAWKLSIYVFHILAFFMTYYSFKRLYRFFMKCKSNTFRKIDFLVIYLFALAYPFTEFIKESGRNYFLVQFTIPYLFEPLYLVITFELFYELFKMKITENLKNFIRQIFLKYLALLMLTGFFTSANPPQAVSNALLMMILAILLILFQLTKKGFKIGKLPIIVFVITILFILLSNIIFIIQILMGSEIFLIYGTSKKIIWSTVSIIGVLTASRPELFMNTQYGIVTPQQVVLESPLLFYFPFTISFYVLVLIIWLGMCRNYVTQELKFLKLVLLGIIINILMLVVFMHGETSEDLVSIMLKNYVKPLTPSFIYNSFINTTTNLVCIFILYYVGFVLIISFITTNLLKQKEQLRKYIAIIIFCIILLSPLNIHYYIIQQKYSKIINPRKVPTDYKFIFNFIKNHPSENYIWIPKSGLIDWRGVHMSNIPRYLGMLFNIDFYFLKTHFVSEDSYFKILRKMYNGEFKPEDFRGYIILEKKYRRIDQEFYDKIRTFIENSQYFICIFDSDNVSLYACIC